MLSTENSAIHLLQDSPNYGPDDLEKMRRAYRRVCEEYPSGTQSAHTQYGLAKSILEHYRPGISENELIACALGRAH